jgi:rhodanese-related sulfurtransferase
MKTRTTLVSLSLLFVLLLATGCMPIQAPVAEAPAAEAAPLASGPLAEAAAPVAEEAPADATAAPVGAAEALDAFASNIPEGFLATGKMDDVQSAMDAGVLMIDVREEGEYAEGHIPGAINIPLRTVAQNLDKIPADQPVLVYCASGLRAGTALSALRTLGYDNVKSFPGGWKAWSGDGREVSTEATEAQTVEPKAVDAELLAQVDNFLSSIPEGFYSAGDVAKLQDAMDNGAFLVDVREPSEFEQGAITGAINVPIRTLMQNLDQIPADQPVIVYCASGHRAAMASGILHMAGYDNVRVFAPGYGAWEAAQDEAGEMPAEVAAAVVSDFDIVNQVGASLEAIPEGYYTAGNLEKFQEMLDATSPVLIDLREESEYAEGHIPGAVNIPLRTLTQNLDQIPTDQPVVVYCASGHRAGMGLAALKMLGYDNVKSFSGGWKAWSGAGAEVSTEATAATPVTPKDVNPEALAAADEFLANIPEGWLAIGSVEKMQEAMDNGAVVIDVREPDEFSQGHIATAVNIPIRTLAANIDQIPTDQPVVVYCASGHRAAMANSALHMMGFGNVRSFPAGYGAWEAAGGATE